MKLSDVTTVCMCCDGKGYTMVSIDKRITWSDRLCTFVNNPLPEAIEERVSCCDCAGTGQAPNDEFRELLRYIETWVKWRL